MWPLDEIQVVNVNDYLEVLGGSQSDETVFAGLEGSGKELNDSARIDEPVILYLPWYANRTYNVMDALMRHVWDQSLSIIQQFDQSIIFSEVSTWKGPKLLWIVLGEVDQHCDCLLGEDWPRVHQLET